LFHVIKHHLDGYDRNDGALIVQQIWSRVLHIKYRIIVTCILE